MSWCNEIIWEGLNFVKPWNFNEFGCLILRVLSVVSYATVIMGSNHLTNYIRSFTFYNKYL